MTRRTKVIVFIQKQDFYYSKNLKEKMNNLESISGFVCFTQFTRYNRIFMQNWKLYFDQ